MSERTFVEPSYVCDVTVTGEDHVAPPSALLTTKMPLFD
jgi:hypothetical protein